MYRHYIPILWKKYRRPTGWWRCRGETGMRGAGRRRSRRSRSPRKTSGKQQNSPSYWTISCCWINMPNHMQMYMCVYIYACNCVLCEELFSDAKESLLRLHNNNIKNIFNTILLKGGIFFNASVEILLQTIWYRPGEWRVLSFAKSKLALILPYDSFCFILYCLLRKIFWYGQIFNILLIFYD